jgi:hypothetical protein
MAYPSDDTCPHCDDSGFQEFASGGIWTGEGVRVRYEICGCICGDDVRRELAEIASDPPPSLSRLHRTSGEGGE